MNRSTLFSFIAGFLLVLVSLHPIMRSGLYSDDLANFQNKTLPTPENKRNVMERSAEQIESWKKKGRYNPLSFMCMEAVYKYCTTVHSYKLFMVLINLVAVAAFLFCLRALNFKGDHGVWMLCLAAVIQYRLSYHDVYTGVNGMYQFISIFVFCALACYCIYSRTSQVAWLCLSLACFVAALLISEVGLTLFFLLPAAAYVLRIPVRRFAMHFLFYIATAGAYMAYTFWLRMHMSQQDAYVGLAMSFDLFLMVKLFCKQLYATIPLSNLHHKAAIPRILWHQLQSPVNLISVLLLVSSGNILLRYIRRPAVVTEPNSRAFYLFAIVLTVSPALFILPSLKYQLEVKWGTAYLPVFLQNFGMATLIACAIQRWSMPDSRWQVWGSKVLPMLMVIFACISFLFNNALISSRSFNFAFPAQVMYEEVRRGALDKCPEGSTIVLANDYYYRAPDNYRLLFKRITGKNFAVFDDDTDRGIPDSAACYLLKCPPGKIVELSVEKIVCSSSASNEVVYRSQTICDIDLIEQERTIANY